MITQCPHCSTRYQVESQALLATAGRARCGDCGSLFDAFSEQAVETAGVDSDPLNLDAKHRIEAPNAPRKTAQDPPFEMPDGLEPLQASADAVIDVEELLSEPHSRPRIVFALIAGLLVLALCAQLAWQQRDTLLQRFPALAPFCDYVECQPTVVHTPDEFRVLHRDIRPTANTPGSLTLSAQVRNDADTAQALPDIQLSLLDNNGTVLIRRRLSPADYRFPPPPDATLIAPGEMFDIDLDFEDPGRPATGFVIDFL